MMEEEKRKLPEFIVVEEAHHAPHFKEDPFAHFKGAKKVKFPFVVHLLAALFFLPVLLWAMIAGAATLTLTLLDFFTLTKIKPLRKIRSLYVSFTKGAFVIALALFTAIFTPMLGLVIVIYYFASAQDSWQKRTVSSFSSRYFS